MNHRHAVPRRASQIDQPQRTIQAYSIPTPHQIVRQATAHHTEPVDTWDEEEQDTWVNRMPNSTRRYTTMQGRELVLTQQPARSAHKQRHPLLYMGVGMLTASALAALILGPGGKWWTDWRNSTDYGNPRTFQTDAIVGQNDGPGHESHFIALNLHGQIIVIEFPGSDPSKGRDFLITSLSGPDAGGVPVTLSFADVNGDGKPDMIVHFNGQEVVYINDHGTFRPAKLGEATNVNG